MTTDTWHPGEKAVQSRAGVADKMAVLGPRLIRDFMPNQHQDFFARLPMILVGGIDAADHLWAIPLFGEPGFIRATSPQLLTVRLPTPSPHPLITHLQVNKPVGLLGIEFETRRRIRLNGYIVERSTDQIAIAVQQSFGNCPKYIRRRERRINPRHGPVSTEFFTCWNTSLRQYVTNADTCFIASVCQGSARPQHRGKNNEGVDISHRGGDSGFVRFDHQQRLLMPDYQGNNFYNTLGNLLVDSRVGLLFLDFSGGHLVSLTGAAEVLWKIDEPTLCGDDQRVVRLTLEKGIVAYNALPYLWTSIIDVQR